MKTKYRCISLPNDLIVRVEERLAAGGYSSVAEYIKEAVRLKLEA